MKITPAKDYKKPLYAIGIAATLMAASVTGCTDLSFNSKNGNSGSGPVDYAGDIDVRPDETDYCKKDADNELILDGEIELEGKAKKVAREVARELNKPENYHRYANDRSRQLRRNARKQQHREPYDRDNGGNSKISRLRRQYRSG